jgi:hypothetical protein
MLDDPSVAPDDKSGRDAGIRGIEMTLKICSPIGTTQNDFLIPAFSGMTI